MNVKNLFEDYTLRDFILEPFKGVFKAPSTSLDQEIYVVITQVAIINAVLAGLPGKMGVGVYVVMALEGWMAYKIAKKMDEKERFIKGFFPDSIDSSHSDANQEHDQDPSKMLINMNNI